ncbi:MAG: glycosyltransferase [Desulfobulbaceae bacterium]|nr:glycosyltransferase [Desulfobulbaceae bacterium]
MDIQPDLSVCVVARHDRATLFGHLGALYGTADPLGLQAIVVVKAGEPLAAELGRCFPEALVYEDEDFAAGSVTLLNRAMELATGRYLVLVDDTAICSPGCLQRLVDFMDDEPEAGLAGPKLLLSDLSPLPFPRPFLSLPALLLVESPMAPIPAAASLRHRHLLADWDRCSSREVEWLSGACLMIRREVWEEIGPLDEGFEQGYADLDYCWRARRAGWHLHFRHDAEMVLTQAPAGEPAPPSWKKLAAGSRFLGKKWLSFFGR